MCWAPTPHCLLPSLWPAVWDPDSEETLRQGLCPLLPMTVVSHGDFSPPKLRPVRCPLKTWGLGRLRALGSTEETGLGVKLPGRGCRALGDNLLSCLCLCLGSGGCRQPWEKLFSTWPPPPPDAWLSCCFLPLDSGTFCRSSLLRMRKADVTFPTRPPNIAPPPHLRASGSLLLHSPVTTALSCCDR